MAGGKRWPTLVVNGYLTRAPSFYIYLIDIEIDEYGQRIVTVGVTHWLLGIYAEIESVIEYIPSCLEVEVICCIYHLYP